MSASAPQPLESRWPAVYAAATAFFALATAASFFWPVWRSGLAAALLLVLVAGIAVGSGRVAAGALGLRDMPEGSRNIVGASLGLGLLSLAVLALSALHLLRPLTVALVLALLWLAGFSELRAALCGCGLPEGWRRRPLVAAGILAPLGVVLWLCWVPPHQYDSLVYHLALPQAYLRAGRLVTPEHLVFSHFPQNGEMLFTLALALQADLLAQMLMWLATALTVGWLWAMSGDLPEGARLLSCLLLVTHTAVMLLSSTTYVEPLAMLWTTAAVLSFWRWGRAAQCSRAWLAGSAVFTGLALGTKYYAGSTAGILALMLLVRWFSALSERGEHLLSKHGGPWPAAADLGLFVAVVTAVFSPWLVKNAGSVGNPFFPFFYRWFETTRAGWPAASAERYFHVLTEYGLGGPWWRALAALPFQLLGNSLRFGGGMDVLGDMGWELVFWALPLALWAAHRSRMLRWLLAFCGLYLAVWLATGVVLRFLTALAPLLCLLAGAGLHALWGRLGRCGRGALAAGVGLLVATHVLVFLFAHAVFGSAAVLLGTEDRQQFLSRRLEYYPCAAFARKNLERNDKILIVGEQRGYYVAQAHTATTVNSPNRFLAWAEAAESPAAYAGRLKAEGFSHVLVVPREAQRLAPGLEALSGRGYRNWEGLEPDFVAPVFKAPACTLYRIK